jgi:hypothetical protein
MPDLSLSLPEPGRPPACSAQRLDGKPCPNRALRHEPFCFIHSPSRAEERAKARRLGGLHRSRGTLPPKRVSLQSAAEILALLEQMAGELVVPARTTKPCSRCAGFGAA